MSYTMTLVCMFIICKICGVWDCCCVFQNPVEFSTSSSSASVAFWGKEIKNK